MINIVKVESMEAGQSMAHELLKPMVNERTLLALSGGNSVNYKKMLVDSADINAGAVCVVDERFGPAFHADSNEFIMKNARLINLFNATNIEFHKYLRGLDFEKTAKAYNSEIMELFAKFKTRVGVMGVGSNLHTAGIFPKSLALKSPHYIVAQEVEDKFRQRLTFTLKALGEFTSFIIMMFGEEKKQALAKMLDQNENDIQSFPAIFYRKSQINAYVVTDITL